MTKSSQVTKTAFKKSRKAAHAATVASVAEQHRNALRQDLGMTPKEQYVLNFLLVNAWDAMGGDSREGLKEDNCSWFHVSDVVKALKIKKEEAAGVVSSLLAKGLVGDAGDGNVDKKAATLYLEEAGIDLAQLPDECEGLANPWTQAQVDAALGAPIELEPVATPVEPITRRASPGSKRDKAIREALAAVAAQTELETLRARVAELEAEVERLKARPVARRSSALKPGELPAGWSASSRKGCDYEKAGVSLAVTAYGVGFVIVDNKGSFVHGRPTAKSPNPPLRFWKDAGRACLAAEAADA